MQRTDWMMRCLHKFVCVCVVQGGGFFGGCVKVGSASVRPEKINKGGAGAGRGDLATRRQHLSGCEVKKQRETKSEHRSLGTGVTKKEH